MALVRIGDHRRHERRRAVQQLRQLGIEAPAKLSKVASTKPSEARSGTFSPEHAARMCTAIGWFGSSASHSSNTSNGFVNLTDRAVRQRQQPSASGCFGLNVMTLQKQSTASCTRFCALRRIPRFVYASECSGLTSNAAR
jgi:hypothetical protein